MRIYLIVLVVVSLFSSAFSDDSILEYPSEIESMHKKAAEEDVNLHCTTWRFAAEMNNLAPWKTIPVECADYVKDYVMGKGYVTDLERVSEEALIFASSVEFSGDGKDIWIFDIDETLLSNLPYYIDHGFGYIFSNSLPFYKFYLILGLVCVCLCAHVVLLLAFA